MAGSPPPEAHFGEKGPQAEHTSCAVYVVCGTHCVQYTPRRTSGGASGGAERLGYFHVMRRHLNHQQPWPLAEAGRLEVAGGWRDYICWLAGWLQTARANLAGYILCSLCALGWTIGWSRSDGIRSAAPAWFAAWCFGNFKGGMAKKKPIAEGLSANLVLDLVHSDRRLLSRRHAPRDTTASAAIYIKGLPRRLFLIKIESVPTTQHRA